MDSLQRFLDIQKEDYFIALREMRDGNKSTHWMWYIFPVHKGLGSSSIAKKYWLDGQEEAKAFLAHPVLGKRLREITEAVLTHSDKSIRTIIGVWSRYLEVQSMYDSLRYSFTKRYLRPGAGYLL